MKPLYLQNYLENPNELYNALLSLDWLNVTEARREYFMSLTPRNYTYGKGVGQREYQSNPFSESIKKILDKLNDSFNLFGDNVYRNDKYNVCFLNRYDAGKNQLGWHRDDVDGTIAVISLGAEREIWWKLQEEKGVVPFENRQKLASGSLFIMPAGFQGKYFHKIPRSDRECGTRISLTFREYR